MSKDIIKFKEYQKQYKLKNKDKIKEYRKKWLLENKEHSERWRKLYYEKNYDKISKRHKERYIKRKEHILLVNTKWKKLHPKYKTQYKKNRYKKDIQYKLRNLLTTRLWLGLNKYTKNGKIKKSKYYGINWEKVIQKLIQEKPKDYNEQQYSIDHIKPLVSFNLENSEEVKQAFAPENHQWMLLKDNCSKGGKY